MAEYIDRQAVLDDLFNLWDWDTLFNLWDWDTVDGIQSSTVLRQVMTDVKNVPSADVRENKRGHWIETEDGGLRCSECGHITGELIDVCEPLEADLPSTKYGITIPKGSQCWALKHPYFCAKCGADMREVDTDD